MTFSIDQIESFFFLYLAGELPIKDFEQWIYSTPEIEGYLGGPAYFEFISFNFQQPAASYELSKLTYKYINPSKFHTWQIKRLLKGLLDGTQDPVVVFENLYNLSWKSYQFLDHIGIQYMLGIDEVPKLTARHLWDENTFLRLRKMLDDYLLPLKEEIETLLQALDSGEIEIINEREYFIKPELSQKLKRMSGDLEQKNSKQSIPSKTDFTMGAYNTLQTNITCPHCKTLVDVEIEIRFGDTHMMDRYVIGDQYKWVSDKSPQRGGRPEKGNLDGEGYTECPNCRRDFFVKVIVRGDRIESVGPDIEKAAYIQASNVASVSSSSETTDQPSTTPAWKHKPRAREIGEIIYNEKWDLTPKIKDSLDKLVKFGVDISSTVRGDDYTILAPHGLSLEQQEEIEALMQKIAKEVKGKVNYVDWYPHGLKFRIYPNERNRSRLSR